MKYERYPAPTFCTKGLPRRPLFKRIRALGILMCVAASSPLDADQAAYRSGSDTLQVGVARVDITPKDSIRLSGYGSRETESEGVLLPLSAKALAFSSDIQAPSILVTVDLIAIPGHVTTQVAERLSEKVGLDPDRFVICASHTHTGPEVGVLLNHFHEPLPSRETAKIALYLEELVTKLEQVSLAALRNRAPSQVSWGQGEVGFAINRRVLDENKQWIGFGEVPDGPVDHALPMLSVTAPDGRLQAVLVNYACHGTTLGPDINHVHGDWMGEAQRIIEENHPGATALVAIGCAGDANPTPRLKLEHTTQHGQAIADEVDRLLATNLTALKEAPVGRKKTIELPYAKLPTVTELAEQAKAEQSTGRYAEIALDRIARGAPLPETVSYPIQTWTFGEDLAMVFLAGEVVVDYAHRLKQETGNEGLWITAYANDVPSYIPSRRLIKEGGYEVYRSMHGYNHPSHYAESIEDQIVQTVMELLPSTATRTEDAQKR